MPLFGRAGSAMRHELPSLLGQLPAHRPADAVTHMSPASGNAAEKRNQERHHADHGRGKMSNVCRAGLFAFVILIGPSPGYAASQGYGRCAESCTALFEGCVAQLQKSSHGGPYSVAPCKREQDACQRGCR